MNKTYMLLAAAACAALAGTADAVTDDEIRTTLRQLWTVSVCGADRDGRHASRAPALPGTEWFDADTNRLVRIMCELAQTNSEWNAKVIMSRVGRYATTNELPILYSCVTNRMCGYGAMEAILGLEGITSNSVAAADRYFFAVTGENDACWHHVVLLSRMRKLLAESCPSEMATNLVKECMQREAFKNRAYPRQIDEDICRFDNGYTTSRRRLSALRAVYALGLNEYQIGYVTNAINELVAYPESELPE